MILIYSDAYTTFSWLFDFIINSLEIRLCKPSQLVLLFYLFFSWPRGIGKFPGQGLNSSQSCDLCHSCSRFLTHCLYLISWLGIESIPPQRQARSLTLCHSGTSSASFFFFFFKDCLGFAGFFSLPYKGENQPVSICKKACGIVDRDCVECREQFLRNIFIFSLSVHECSISLHLFKLISPSNIL